MELKQEVRETVNSFWGRIQSLSRKASSVSEVKMKLYFIQGLLPCYKDKLELDLELDMKNLLTKAIRLDSLGYYFSATSEPTTFI